MLSISTKNTNFKNRILELDSLRGIAALLVVVYHFCMENIKYKFQSGLTGVDMFFIISGFVIFLTLKKTKTWQDFIVSRFSRLYPAYWISVTLTTLAVVIAMKGFGQTYFDKNITIIRYLGNMSMFQYYFKIHNIDGPYWTLTVELIFYLFMLIIFQAKQLNKIEIIGLIILLSLIPYSLYTPVINHSKFHFIIVALPLIGYFPLFFSGIIFYKLKFEGQTFYRYCFIITCLLVQLALFKDSYGNSNNITFSNYRGMLCIYYTLFILYVNNWLQFIVNPITLFLGRISYSLYLIHQFIGASILMHFFTQYCRLSFFLAFLISFSCIVMFATLINTYIENPSLNFIRGKYQLYLAKKQSNKIAVKY